MNAFQADIVQYSLLQKKYYNCFKPSLEQFTENYFIKTIFFTSE